MSTRTAPGHARAREPRFSFLSRLGRKTAAPPPVAPGLAHDREPAGPWTGESQIGVMAPEDAPPLPRRGTAPDLADITLTDKPLGVLRPETAPERTAPGPDLAAAPQDRPYVPQDGGLPSSWLRAIPQSGPGGRVLETLTGMPFYAGIRHDPDGSRIGGLCWGAADDIWLAQDIKSVEVADAALAALRELREDLAYGAFRAPAVPADPEAAEHREVLERELDDCMEQARGVLRAAGNLGFLSADLRRRNGEGVMDVFVARAALANAVENGDEPVALKAAERFVGVISELCDDETACAIANGIAPPEEAVARAEDEPDGDTGEGPADGQDGPVAA